MTKEKETLYTKEFKDSESNIIFNSSYSLVPVDENQKNTYELQGILSKQQNLKQEKAGGFKKFMGFLCLEDFFTISRKIFLDIIEVFKRNQKNR